MSKRTVITTLVASLIVSSLSIIGTEMAVAGPGPTCLGSPSNFSGTPGNDVINGTNGPDVITGQGGNDVINGKGGNDIICGSDDSDPADGKDIIHEGAGNGSILGGKGNDELFGDGDRDNMFGGPGNDLINGGANAAGVGDDANYWFANNPVNANLATGNATGEGSDTLVKLEGLGGTPFNDTLVGNNKDNNLEGGNEFFSGQTGDDILRGAGGTDTLSLFFADDPNCLGGPLTCTKMFVNLQGGTSIGDGVDEIDSFENVIGSSYNDYITGTDGVNALFGNEGHDTLFARSGDDIMIGFSGEDSIFGGVGTADFVSYSDGNLAGLPVTIDLASGDVTRSDGNDTLDGVEMVEGSSENDSIYGDNGPNFFYSDLGDDTINGRGGSDLVFFLGAGPGGVEADLGEGTATGMNASGPDVLNNIEHLVGSSYVDELIGDNNRNFLNGSNGVDHVVGAGNNDYISGGTGGDILEGGPGNQDMVDFFQSKNSVNLDLGTSPATATGEGNDELFQIEAASGSKKADHFEGNSAANFFYGQKGADNLLGFGGGDHLDGGPKTDTLVGGPANDECFKKSESSSCEDFSQPDEHPLSSYSRRYKKAVAAARRYKRRYK